MQPNNSLKIPGNFLNTQVLSRPKLSPIQYVFLFFIRIFIQLKRFFGYHIPSIKHSTIKTINDQYFDKEYVRFLRMYEGFAKPKAEQNLDSFPYATKGCSVEDPKGPLTRISKADSENNENDEENIFLEKHINSETEGFTESLASLDASGAKENLDSFPYATKGCSVEDPNGPLTRISKADSEKNETDNDSKNILEVNVDIEDLSNNDTIFIKKRNDIYYQMYKEAKRKAKMARDLAISSYLEAKHIKNTYMIENEDSDSDFDEESFEGIS